MAIVLVEGYDAYNGTSSATPGSLASSWYNIGSGFSLVSGRYGGQAVRCAQTISVTANMRKGLPTSLTQGAVGFAIRPIFQSSGVWVQVGLWDSTNRGLSLRINQDLSISIGLNGGSNTDYNLATVFATTPAATLTLNTWSYIELEFTVSNTTGSYNLYVNGGLASSGTNLDTLSTSSYTVLCLGGTFAGTSTTYEFDDVYVTDTATRLGEQRVETLYPNADTAQKQWTASTGSDNYAMIDETTMNTTDYVYTSTLNNYDLYDFGNLSTTPTSISAVTVSALAQKDNVGTRAIATPIKSSSTTSDGGNIYLAGGWSVSSRILETDPNTSTAWTASGVNNLQAGVKVTI